MTQELITIEEIVRLDSKRTQGVWASYKYNNHCDGESGAYFVQCSSKRISYDNDLVDAAFIAASPRIAAKAIALDEVNKELVEALKGIAEYGWSGLCGSDAHRMMEIATEALTKAGAL